MKKTLSMLSALILLFTLGLMGCNGSGDDGSEFTYSIQNFDFGEGNWKVSWDESDVLPVGGIDGEFSWRLGTSHGKGDNVSGFIYNNTDLADILADDDCLPAADNMTETKFRALVLNTGEVGVVIMLFIPMGTGQLQAAYCAVNLDGPGVFTPGSATVVVKKN